MKTRHAPVVRRNRAPLVAVAALLLAPFSDSGARADDASPEPDAAAKPYSLHGESTFVWQANAPFRALYSGDNSLRAHGQGRETLSATMFVGLRLWRGGELYINPEMFQGFGLAGTHGLAGFPNGEAQKGGTAVPEVYLARGFVRQTFGLGGETEKVEDGPNQIAGQRDVARLTWTTGKLAPVDIFDGNSYARDPRDNFLNWSIYSHGAFDYAADQKGYGWGTVLDFNQKNWALRGGYFLEPKFSNSERFDLDIPRRGQYLLELETRHQIAGQAGKIRYLGWFARANAGNFREAVADPAFDPSGSIEATRRTRTLYGVGVSLEQAITADLGLFARASLRDGRNEVMAWTDVDRSVTAGLALKGTAWRRPDDTIGFAGVLNGLGRDYRRYLAAGGLGINIGDGQLSYRPEAVLETYYSLAVRRNVFLTLDYQFAPSPAYNADRGPVSIGAMRLHAHF